MHTRGRYNSHPQVLIDAITGLRKQKGLTQDQMAKAIGAKQAFVSKYETGERRLDFLDLVAICKVLSMSIAKFAERFETARNRNLSKSRIIPRR